MPDEKLIESRILLARLGALIANPPSFADYRASSQSHNEWVGKVHAIIKRADPSEDLNFGSEVSWLHSTVRSIQEGAWGKIWIIVSRVMTSLELRAAMTSDSSNSRDQAFGPGAIYDFFKALSAVIASAKQSLLIVDPYMDAEIFDKYLASAGSAVTARLLIRKQAANVKAAAQTFASQHGLTIQVRNSSKIHDRLVFVDGLECWVLGSSINAAATAKPTYLAPLSPDVSELKLSHYDEIWNNAS